MSLLTTLNLTLFNKIMKAGALTQYDNDRNAVKMTGVNWDITVQKEAAPAVPLALSSLPPVKNLFLTLNRIVFEMGTVVTLMLSH